ncbi:hypothetical protein HY479_00085 [Candidatus Uhrbacteria bacterium]|nr:hypothetical protein [Candidatus Uhrbacteria bacterium]
MRPPGYIALVSLTIISAIMVVVAAGLLVRAAGGGKIVVASDTRDRAASAAQACAEMALIRLKDNDLYSGNEILDVNGDTCAILPITGSGSSRTVQTTSTVSGYSRKIRIQITTINPTMQIGSWEDVADF